MSPAPIQVQPEIEQNPRRSTGPRTAAGKDVSRNNAWRHGLTGQVACMPFEDQAAFDAFCARIVAAYQPEGEIEAQIANDIAEDRWRINRIRSIENNIFAVELETAPDVIADSQNDPNGELHTALTQTTAFLENAPAFGILSLYESRIGRKIAKNEQTLNALQKERRAAYERALEQEVLLAELALHNGENHDASVAAVPGAKTDSTGREFVFSNVLIAHLVERKRRLTQARALFNPARGGARAAKKAA